MRIPKNVPKAELRFSFGDGKYLVRRGVEMGCAVNPYVSSSMTEQQRFA